MQIIKHHYLRLIGLCEDLGIKVITLRNDSPARSACWNPAKQTITIGIKKEPWSVLLGLSHELGHCLSVRKGTLAFGAYLLYRLDVPLSDKLANMVLDEECRAWRLGFNFLRRNNLPIDNRMLAAKKERYATHLRKLGYL
jgi:hypothetical protein